MIYFDGWFVICKKWSVNYVQDDMSQNTFSQSKCYTLGQILKIRSGIKLVLYSDYVLCFIYLKDISYLNEEIWNYK